MKICTKSVVVDKCENCPWVDRVFDYKKQQLHWHCNHQYIRHDEVDPDTIPDWCLLPDKESK